MCKNAQHVVKQNQKISKDQNLIYNEIVWEDLHSGCMNNIVSRINAKNKKHYKHVCQATVSLWNVEGQLSTCDCVILAMPPLVLRS